MKTSNYHKTTTHILHEKRNPRIHLPPTPPPPLPPFTTAPHPLSLPPIRTPPLLLLPLPLHHKRRQRALQLGVHLRPLRPGLAQRRDGTPRPDAPHLVGDFLALPALGCLRGRRDRRRDDGLVVVAEGTADQDGEVAPAAGAHVAQHAGVGAARLVPFDAVQDGDRGEFGGAGHGAGGEGGLEDVEAGVAVGGRGRWWWGDCGCWGWCWGGRCCGGGLGGLLRLRD